MKRWRAESLFFAYTRGAWRTVEWIGRSPVAAFDRGPYQDRDHCMRACMGLVEG